MLRLLRQAEALNERAAEYQPNLSRRAMISDALHLPFYLLVCITLRHAEEPFENLFAPIAALHF